MVEPGKIQGEKIVDLLNQLISKRTIVSMQVMGTGFEQLVTISAIGAEQETKFLLIDRPRNFKQPDDPPPLHLRFNFNGPDKLAYVFDTVGGHVDGSVLKIPFPEYAERLQRRNNFRIATPPGVRLMFGVEDLQCALELVNISAGGALGLILKPTGKDTKGRMLQNGQVISKAALSIPADGFQGKQVVLIEKAQICRIEHDYEKQLLRYAFEFIDIEKKEKKKLIQFIYHLQRQYLRRR